MWPLLVIALAAGSVGYYLALSAPEPTLDHTGAFGIEAGAEVGPDVIDQQAGPVEFRYRPGEQRRLEYALNQSDTTRSSGIVTHIDIELTEEREKSPAETAVKFDRTYERVGVTIEEDGQSVQPEIAAQIESLLTGTRSISTVDAIGKPGEFEWRSVTNPQVRQTLDILRHSTRLLMPRMRRGAVNPGESWQYDLPATGVAGRFVTSIDGELSVEDTFVGTTSRGGRRLAILDRSFDVEASGEVETADLERARHFELSGEGSGRVLFDVEGGAIVESRLTISRTLQLEKKDGETVRREGDIDLLLQEKAG